MHQIFPCIPSGESTEPPALPPPPGTKLLDLPDALIGSIFTQLQGDRKSRRALLHSCQALHQSDHCRQQVCLCVFVCACVDLCVCMCVRIFVCACLCCLCLHGGFVASDFCVEIFNLLFCCLSLLLSLLFIVFLT